jgi:hypothetical protein
LEIEIFIVMRYVISQSQFHKLIYKTLDSIFSEDKFKKEVNPYVEDGNTWRIYMYDENGKELISYFWYGSGGTYDDDTQHNGIGSIHVHYELVDLLRTTFSIRESKVLDIIADWLSQKLNVDVDEISLYPHRKTSVVY